jgi:hypothetical protein
MLKMGNDERVGGKLVSEPQFRPGAISPDRNLDATFL